MKDQQAYINTCEKMLESEVDMLQSLIARTLHTVQLPLAEGEAEHWMYNDL